MSEFIRKVVDQQGIRYNLTEKLGGGTQGDVFKVDGGKYAVKILFKNSLEEEERLKFQLAEVRRLDLDGLPIARPIRILRAPDVGYVMDLADGMDSIKKRLFPHKEPNIIEWYTNSGGLRRRLRILLRIGNVLGKVHSYGLVYPDISHKNILISKPTDQEQVLLIDADNIHYNSSPGRREVVYTPGFGAPELVNRKTGMNSISDAFAFAVLIFQVLSLVHPFEGDLVDKGAPESRDEAYQGKFPWIDQQVDDKNRSSNGIPRTIVLTPTMQKLAKKTFEDDLFTPVRRPSIPEWTEALGKASQSLINCPECGRDYYFNHRICPWCLQPRPTFLLLDVKLFDPKLINPFQKMLGNPEIIYSIAVSPGMTKTLDRTVIEGYHNEHSYDPILEICLEQERVTVKSLDQKTYYLTTPEGNQTEEVKDRPRNFMVHSNQLAWLLHLGPLDKLHRVLLFNCFPETNQESA